ncbi:MAG: 2-hydroxyacyl-CoA dehydratase subunit D [Bacillota bacterium]
MEEKKKNTASKSLNAAREASYFGKKMLASARTAVQEGRPFGWSMADWWLGQIIAKAMGIELVFPENYGAFCAAVGQAEPNLDYCEMDGYPATLCGYARNCIGYTRKLEENDFVIPDGSPGGGMPKPIFLLGSGAACDTRFKWFQSLGRYMEVPVWVLETPHSGTAEYFMKGYKEKNIAFMVKELKEFVKFLEGLTGKKMNYDTLSEKIDTTFKSLGYAYEVDLLRKASPSPMLSTDFWAVVTPTLFCPDDPEALQFFKRMYEEVKARVDNGIGAIPNEKYRMMFAELPPWHSLGIFDHFAQKHGIAFVIETFGYHAPVPLSEEETDGISDPLELIARFTYQKWHHTAETARKYDMDPISSAGYLEYAKEYNIDGLFAHPLLSCRPATYALMHVRNLLMEKFKIPSLVVEGDIVDFRVFNLQDTLSKMDAFVESMDHFREVRRQQGLQE